MAEAQFKDLLKKMTLVLPEEVTKEVGLLIGVEDEIEKLSKTFKTIISVLEDAEQKQVTVSAVKEWLEDLKDAAYDMEDLLKEWIFKYVHHQSIKDKVLYFLSSLCPCLKPVIVRHNVGHQIKAIRERLDFLMNEKNKIKLVEGGGSASGLKEPDRKAFITTSITDASKIYGRNHDKDFIISKLLLMSTSDGSSSSSSTQVPVDAKGIPIIAVIGMGGMGKTSLAQLVYNDHQVKNHFEKKMWVCVSDPFDKVRLAKEIIGGPNQHTASDWNDQLHCSLCDAVKAKRFLLVLDDVWNEDYNEWGLLKLALDYGSQGSWILVTTRSERVALTMLASFTHDIEGLPELDCWSLFSSIAFADSDIKDNEKAAFEHVGKEIVKKGCLFL